MSTKRKPAPTSAASPAKKSKTAKAEVGGGPPQFIKKLAPGAASSASSASSGSPGSPGSSDNKKHNYREAGPERWKPNPATGKKEWLRIGDAFTVLDNETGEQVPITAEVLGDTIKAAIDPDTTTAVGTHILTMNIDGQALKQVVHDESLYFTNTVVCVRKVYKNGNNGLKLCVEFVMENPNYDPEDPESKRFIRDEKANKNAETMLFSFPKLIFKYWVERRTKDGASGDSKSKKKLLQTLPREWKPLLEAYENAWDRMFDDGFPKPLAETTFEDFVWHPVNRIPKTMDVGDERFFATQGEDGGKLEPLVGADGNPVPYDGQEMDYEDFPSNAEFHMTTKLFKQRFSPGKYIYIFTQSSHFWEGNAYADTIPPHKPGRMHFVGQAKDVVYPNGGRDDREVLALTVAGLTAEQAGETDKVLHEGDVVRLKKLRGANASIMKKPGALPSPKICTFRGDTIMVLHRTPGSYPLDPRSYEERKSAEGSGGGSSYSNYDQFAELDAKWRTPSLVKA